MSEIKIYDCRNGQEREITNGVLSPYPILRKDSEAQSAGLNVAVIPMKIKAAAGYRILSIADTAEGGLGCRLYLQHDEAGTSGSKSHWWISNTTSIASSSGWIAAAPHDSVGGITISGGADAINGADFWLKCDCEPLESIGVHDYAKLSADGVVASVTGG